MGKKFILNINYLIAMIFIYILSLYMIGVFTFLRIKYLTVIVYLLIFIY
jgi:hypothetical protein